jgi:hypothetical protein
MEETAGYFGKPVRSNCMHLGYTSVTIKWPM